MAMILLFILFVIFAVGLAPAIVYYDKIINYMYGFRQDIWTEVGSPPGFLRKPTLPSGIFESSAQIFIIKLFFATPLPMYSDDTLKVLIKKYKMHLVIWMVGAASLFCLACVVL